MLRRILPLLVLLTGLPPAFAAPAPGGAPPAVQLGRKNPFMPIQQQAPVTGRVPPQPPQAARSPQPAEPAFDFVGVVTDHDEAIAAVREHGATRMVRVGELVAGARVVSISSQRLVLERAGRELVKRLSRASGG